MGWNGMEGMGGREVGSRKGNKICRLPFPALGVRDGEVKGV